MKRIFVIATGGTIAGVAEGGGQRYRSGELSVSALLDSVPGLGELAQIEAYQLANIGSQDMSEALWLKLAALVAQRLDAADCDGVVIIHGTDTLEETAFFLHCVLPQSAKPVVITGAMRPATAVNADGPRNLFAAVALAASDASAGRGVLVVFAGQVFAAASVGKIHTQNLDAFGGGECGAIGHVRNLQISGSAEVVYEHSAVGSGAGYPHMDLAALAAQGALPRVAVVTAHVGQSPDVIEALVELGYRGIVYAGLGNGNLSAKMLAALKTAQQRGLVIVRASRVPQGGVTACGEVDDAEHGFVCAGKLSPQQARIVLALALSGTGGLQRVREWFALFNPVF